MSSVRRYASACDIAWDSSVPHFIDILEADFRKILAEKEVSHSGHQRRVSHGLVVGFVQNKEHVPAFFRDTDKKYEDKAIGIDGFGVHDKIYVVTPSGVYEIDPVERGWNQAK